MNEADTCRVYVTPNLQVAGWDREPHRISEQVTFTDGRIVVMGQRAHRRVGKRADYILRFLNLETPMPDLTSQEIAERVWVHLAHLKAVQAETATELDALLPSILDKAFKGEL
jgi:hypothetical protein